MANNLTLSVTLTGDNRQLSGTLKDAQGDVREFSTTTERESKKAETALEAPGRSAGTVSQHLRGAQREARSFGAETTQSGLSATQALIQTSNEAQTTALILHQLQAVAAGVGVAFATMGVRDFVMDTYAAVSGSQQLQASLKTVTGSIENASTAWDTLLGFAADTPFTLDQSVQGFIRMQSLGLNPTLEALRSYGNTSAAMGKDMMQMVEAVADATTGEFERLKEFGIRASKEGEQISFTFQGVTTTVANSANAISQYLQQIGENQFAGAMADQMDTLSGKASNLEDGIYQFYLAIGDAGATEVFESTLANASNTVQFLTDNIDTLASGAEVMAVLIGGRVVVALANATAAKLAATQQTIAYQLALARMAGVSGTAAAAQTALAGASRAAAGALTLVGGPVGAAMLAGGAIYYFREELGLVAPKVQSATERVDDMTSALDANSEAALKNAKAMLEAEQQFQQFRQATLAMDVSRQRQIVADEQKQWDAVGGQAAFGMGQRSESQQALNDLQVELMNTRNAIDAAGGSVTEIDEKLAQLERTTRETITPTTDLGNANEAAAAKAKELAKSTEAQADALEDLYDRLVPGRRETVQLARDIQTLNLAIAMGTGNIGQNIQAMGLLQQQYIEAQNDTDDLADKTVDAAFTMEGAWDEVRLNGLRRLDDGFADLWESAIDGSLNAGELMKKALAQTLAEMAHMAITRPITVQLATSMGFGGSGAGGQQGGGGFNMGSLKNGWDTVSGLWGGGSAVSTAAAGYGAAGWAGSATGAYTGFAGSAAAGAAQAGTGLMGAASAAAPWLAGGMLIDNVLGLGIVDGIVSGISGLFSGSPTKFSGRFGTTASLDRSEGAGKDGVFEHQDSGRFYRETALGYAGFRDQGTERLQRAGVGEDKQWAEDLVNATAAMDALTVSVARSDEQVSTMRDTVQGLEASGRNAGEIIEFALKGRAVAALESVGHTFSDAISSLPADEFTARLETMAGGMGVLMQSADRLNLQFDDTAAGALEAAGNLAQIAGGVENLATLQDQYYQAYFSEAERAANLQADLTASLNAMGLALPANEAGFRALVEAQNQNTDSGARNYVQLLQLSGAFDQLQDMLGQTDTGVRSFTDQLSAARDALATAEDQTRRAYDVFSNQAFDQQIELLNLMGDAEGALALERERELATIDESLRPTQERIWAIQDEIAAQQNATAAAQNYQRELASVRDQLNQQFAQNAGWLDQQQATSGAPETNLATAQEQLARQLVLAENGDRDALNGITQYADRVLEANQAYNASSAAGQRIQEDVYAAIRALPESISAEQFLVDEIKTALREQTQGISTQLGDVLRGDNPSNIAVNLANYFETLAGGIDGVLTREQLAIVMSGKASDAQLTAIMRSVDINGDGVMSGLESVIIQALPSDTVLGTVLRNKMNELDKNQLTHAQIRNALSPIATDAEISRLIRGVDVNGDGIISSQELTNARISGLASGIAKSLNPAFDMLDSNLDGKLTFAELSRGLEGIATDDELRAILRAVDLSGDGIVSGLESVVIADMPTDAVLLGVLEREAQRLGERQLSEAQVRSALNGIATDDEISRLITRTDANGRWIWDKLDWTNQRLAGLAMGIGSTLKPMFDNIDLDASGMIDWQEFYAAFEGLASDNELQRIFNKLDVDGSGQISRLEALKHSSEGTQGNTQTLEERAREQLDSLSGLVGEMARTTGQFIDLNENILSLNETLGAIKIATEKSAQLQYFDTRQTTTQFMTGEIANSASVISDARENLSRQQIANFDKLIHNNRAQGPTGAMDQEDWERIRNNVNSNDNLTSDAKDYILHRAATLLREANIARWEREIAGHEYSPNELSYTRINGSHAAGLWNVPFDGYLAELHKDEMVAPAKTANLLRDLPNREPGTRPLPTFPALGNNDVIETLRDLKREVSELRKDNARLHAESNRHLAAANNQRGEGFKRQIAATERGNRSLDDMGANARLEASR